MPPRGRKRQRVESEPEPEPRHSSTSPDRSSPEVLEQEESRPPFYNTTFSTHRVSPLYVGKQPLNPFIDDIVIASNTLEDHLKHLGAIFSLFTSKGISISPKESYLGYPSVELLGFKVDALGLTTTAERIAALKNLAFPDQLKALEHYIGSSGFLRHLVPYYAQLSEPLQNRKVALLAKGRELGKVVVGNASKRAHYCVSTKYDPTPAELESFRALQEALCGTDDGKKPSILYHHDPDKQLFMQIDGSIERGFGVMIFHLKDGYEWRPGTQIPASQVLPVMFLSKCLTKAETRYGPSELEVACLVWAVRRLRTTIHSANQPVIVLTDHSATKGIVEQTNLRTTSTDRGNRRLINASIYLSQYDLQIFHIPGKLNFVPDALSRLRAIGDGPNPDGEPALDNLWKDGETYTVITEDQALFIAEAKMNDAFRTRLVEGYKSDKKFVKVLKDLEEATEDGGTLCRLGYPFVVDTQSQLIYHNRPDGSRALCIPFDCVKEVLQATHDEKHHFRRQRMMYDLRDLAIPHKTSLVKKYLKHCPECQLNQTSRDPPNGSYQAIRPEHSLPMSVIAIDFIVGLPEVPAANSPWKLEGHETFDTLMTVTDKATKRTLLIPGHSSYTAEEWGKMLTRQLILADWGMPKGIISDRDRRFTSELWTGIWKAWGTRLLMTTAYHPQADGLSERKNQTVEIAIRFHYFMFPDSDWHEILPVLQWNLNSALTQPANMSPHEQLYGFKLPGPLDTLLATEHDPEAPVIKEHLRQDAILAMDFAAADAKRRYDDHHRDVQFKKGDKVFLRLHHGYHHPGNPSRKLSQQRSGPYTILEKVGNLAYRLELPRGVKIHPVISVAHLSLAPDGKDVFGRDLPPPGPVEDSQHDDEYEVEIILKHKEVQKKLKYLIKWKGWGHQYNCWMTERSLENCQKLLTEYWDRQGGRPGQKRGRGRPKGSGKKKA